MKKISRVKFTRTITHQGIEFYCLPCTDIEKQARIKEQQGHRTLSVEFGQKLMFSTEERFLFVSKERHTIKLTIV